MATSFSRPAKLAGSDAPCKSDPMDAPLRCPQCDALVVDRRFSKCTTCAAELPEGWAFPPGQVEKLKALNHGAEAEHAALMGELGRETEVDDPLLTADDDPVALD